ncbi:unnamed protein product [Camellia sinensis]
MGGEARRWRGNGGTARRGGVKLPELMAYVNIEEKTLVRLRQKLLDFLKSFCRRIRALSSFLLMTPLKFPKGVARGKIIEQQLLFHQQCDHTCYCLKAKAFCRIA